MNHELNEMKKQDPEWSANWQKTISTIGRNMTYNTAASKLREVIQTNLLTPTDIQDNPDRFFLAHRLGSLDSLNLGPGFSIRFTVHYNLFAGTVVALGTDKQIQDLVRRNSVKPRLGCFALTEKLAGVNSGLVVNTTAVLENGSFVINTPFEGAEKNWISQGLVADEAVVVANLSVNGKNLGPQAFLVSFRENGTLVNGVTVKDMGPKSVGNDLDNASISFKNLKCPLDALLSRYVTVTKNGQVSYPEGNLRTMDMIGQRLFSGRICVAQAALIFAKSLFDKTRAFASQKKCWAPGNAASYLINVPQLNALYQRSDKEFSELFGFMDAIERELCDALRQRKIPSVKLQERIAVGKVKAIESSITLCHALKQEVGSYALMVGSGFEQMDFITCCKFAEGDSRILMQKMARDVFVRGAQNEYERVALTKLKTAFAAELKKGVNKRTAWDNSFELVYDLAEAHMRGVMENVATTVSKL